MQASSSCGRARPRWHSSGTLLGVYDIAPTARELTIAPVAMLLIQLLVVQIYFFSAIGKLERTGLSWGSAEHMQLWLLWFNQDSQSVVFGTLGPWIAQFGWLTGAIGAATVLFEWCMPQAMKSMCRRRGSSSFSSTGQDQLPCQRRPHGRTVVSRETSTRESTSRV